MSDQFVPIYSLEKLSDEQKHQYYLDACEFLDLPPALNLLEYLWMDSGTGRNLILYARRGATDLIRQNRGISIVELTKEFNDGYVIFTATGRDKQGRTEMAVGAALIKGSKDLSAQFAVAQTRACRRMTLQFVGGGILDESEAVGTAVATPQAYQDVKPATQPTVAPNADAGADVTSTTVSPNPSNQGVSVQTVADIKADIKTRRPKKRGVDLSEGWTPLDAPKVITAEYVQPTVAEEAVVLNLPAEPKPSVDNVEKISQPLLSPADLPIDIPTPEQFTEFRKRISEYTNNILPQAGMVPSENIGGVGQKLRVLASKLFPQVVDMKYLSLDQWSEFFEFLDVTLAKEGAAALVKKINTTIGIAE